MLLLAVAGLLAAGVAEAGPLRLAFPYKIQYLPMIICSDGRAAEVQPVIGTGGIDAAEALLAGEADIGAMGDAPALILLSRNPRFQVICAFMQSPVMHRLVAGREFAGLQDLYGRRLAVHHGSSTHGALLAYLAEQHIDLSRISLVPLSPVNFPEALLNGAVAAIAGSDPWPDNVLQRVPGSHVLATLTVSGNNFPHVLIADRKYLAGHGDEIAGLLSGLAAGCRLIAADPQAAAALAARVTNRSPEAEAAALARLHYGLDFSPAVADGLEKTAAFLARQRKVKNLPEPSTLLPLKKFQP